MFSTKILTPHESAIAALRPGIGSTISAPALTQQVTSVSCQVITFRIQDCYDEIVLEEAFQTLLDRGGDYYKIEGKPGFYEARIPAEFDPQPYMAVLKMATDAITDIELQTELRIEIGSVPKA